MSSVDSRIVTMKFDNSTFQKGVAATIGALQKLKTGLTGLPGKSLDGLNESSKKFNMNNLSNAVGGVSAKFAALATVGITALANITNRAVNAGVTLAKSLTIDPIMQGFHEYETNLNSIQTVLSNTKDQGTNLQDVNKALQQLNTYSDKTIYNFSEMARNIGTFTAAGVDLKTSVASIKGIANLAAISGSSSEQASTAMYQLSQAISAGRVGLQDWNSVVNAGMGGAVFQKALTRTAVNMGKLKDSQVKLVGPMHKLTVAGGSFRESIQAKPGQTSWLTSDVLTNTLKQLSGDMTDAQLAAQGFNKEQIKAIQAQAKAGVDAATKVKTLTQLLDTLKESVGSGWTRSFQLILGNFNEAKNTFTAVSNTLGTMIKHSANARNRVLKDWKAMGGRTALIQSIVNIFHALLSVIDPIRKAFRDIFPAITGKQLAEITKTFERFTAHLTLSGKTSKGLRSTFRGLFAILGIGVDIAKNVIKYFASLAGLFLGGSGSVLTLTGSIGDLLVKFHDWLVVGGKLDGFFDKIIGARAAVLKPIIAFVGQLVEGLAGLITSGAAKFGDWLQSLAPMAKHVEVLVTQFKAMAKSKALEFVDKIIQKFNEFRPTLDKLVASAKQFAVSLGHQIAGGFLTVKDIFTIFLAFVSDFWKNLGPIIAGGLSNLGSAASGIGSAISNAIGGIKNSLGGLNLGSIFDIGGQTSVAAAGLHQVNDALGATAKSAGAAKAIWGAIVKAFSAIGNFFQPVWEGIKNVFSGLKDRLLNFVHGFGIQDSLAVVNTGFFIAFYIMLRRFVKGLKGLTDSFKGTLDSITGVFDQVTNNLKTMQNNVKANIILKIAAAIALLAAALFILSKIPVKNLAVSLGAVGALMFMLFRALGSLDKDMKLKQSASMAILATSVVALAAAVVVLAGAVAILGRLKVSTLAKGLGAVAAIMAIVVSTTTLLGKSGGALALGVAAAGMIVLAAALVAFAGAIKLFASIKAKTIENGGLKIVAVLAALALVLHLMPTGMVGMAAGLFIIANALVVMAGAMKIFGNFSVKEMAKSLIMLGGALAIMAIAANLMVEALPGAAAILVFAIALAALVPSLLILGNMSIKQIAIAIGALAAVFTVLGVAALVLTPVVPVIFLLAQAIGLLGLAMLGIGVGMLAFAAGLALLAASGVAGVAVLTAAVISIAELIPLIMQQFGLGIIAFAKVIAKAGPPLVKAFSTLLYSMLQAVIDNTPQLGRALTVMLITALKIIRDTIPDFIKTGVKVLVSFLKGIRDNMWKITDLVISIVLKFLSGLADRMPKIVDAGFKMIIKFLNGMTKAINNNSQALGTAGGNLAVAIINGFVNGIGAFGHVMVDAARGMASRALHAMFHVFDSNSPSKETHKLGTYAGQGLANGLNAYSKVVEKSAAGMAGDALDVISVTMSKIPQALADNVDMSPVITPVLDLTKLQEDASKIGTSIPTATIGANVSLGQASDISNAQQAAQNASASAAASSEVRDVTFVQNNTSPKALSPVEIYRNTKSQISMAKEALK